MTSKVPSDKVNWMRFPDGRAKLFRFVMRDGKIGLILRSDAPEGVAVLDSSKRFGFKPVSGRANMRILLPDASGAFPVRMSELCAGIGAERIMVPREVMVRKATIIEKAPAPPPGPDPRGAVMIGRNRSGDEVVQAVNGRFITGNLRVIQETAENTGPDFLRVLSPAHIDDLAHALVRSAERGTVHRADLERMAGYAADTFDGSPGPFRDREIEEALTEAFAREIIARSVSDDASRAAWRQASRTANMARPALTRPTDEEPLLAPSLHLSMLLRRITRGYGVPKVTGSEDLSWAFAEGRVGNHCVVADIGAVHPSEAGAYARNLVTGLADDGVAVMIVPGGSESDAAAEIRAALGVFRSVEGTLEMTSEVADGAPGTRRWTMMVFGDVRPEVIDSLPPAAFRVMKAQESDDLLSFEGDVLRARRRIGEHHRGIETDVTSDRENNSHQRPYTAMSRVAAPFTMIPMSLEGAVAKAQERVMRYAEPMGGVDGMVSSALGMGIADMSETLSAEQVDGIAQWIDARRRNRAVLDADETGVGKGRMSAAIARIMLREDPDVRVVMFTENPVMNAPDVMRDLDALGIVDEAILCTTGTRYNRTTLDSEGRQVTRQYRNMTLEERRAMIDSGVWPDANRRVMIMTHGLLREGPEGALPKWLIEQAKTGKLRIINDEAHNAANLRSRAGVVFSQIKAHLRHEDVIDFTATPMGKPEHVRAYPQLLPASMSEAEREKVLNAVISGGEPAREAFTTMITEDGCFLRRGHDVTNVTYGVITPSDEVIKRHFAVMRNFAGVMEMALSVGMIVKDMVAAARNAANEDMLGEGVPDEAARARSRAMNQYGGGIGGPLDRLIRMMLSSMKFNEQVVDAVEDIIARNHKPLVSFDGTMETLFSEILKEGGFEIGDEIDLSLSDQVRRVTERVFFARIDGELVDMRERDERLRTLSDSIESALGRLPDWSASPLDHVRSVLEDRGYRTGEISGRSVAYRGGVIERRGKEERDKREIMRQFNDGEIDILFYNRSGATGVSMHAGPLCKDQRMRETVNCDVFQSPVKFVQGAGRTNRYLQVENPVIHMLMTGLVPEMRILQMLNAHLRQMGASVDGNRSHPMLIETVPDLLNRVGSDAMRAILEANPDLIRRMVLEEHFSMEADEETGEMMFDSLGEQGTDHIANKVMTRLIILDPDEQDRFIRHVMEEFSSMVEELDRKNRNPLVPKMFAGEVEILRTSLFSGTESDDPDVSAFSAPLYVSTGIQRITGKAWDADMVGSAISKCASEVGADGFRPYAETLRRGLADSLRAFLSANVSIEDAMREPALGGALFESRKGRREAMIRLMSDLAPGSVIDLPEHLVGGSFILDNTKQAVVVGMRVPPSPSDYGLASAWAVDLIAPGSVSTVRVRLSALVDNAERVSVAAPGAGDSIMEKFPEPGRDETIIENPVQILHGNLISGLIESEKNNLGMVSLYRLSDGSINRGIVVDDSQIDLERLPVEVSDPLPLVAFARMLKEGEITKPLERAAEYWKAFGTDAMKDEMARNPGRIPDKVFLSASWRNKDDEKVAPTVQIIVRSESASITVPPLRAGTWDFYRVRPGLHEAVYDGEPMPRRKSDAGRAIRQRNIQVDTTSEEGLTLLAHLTGLIVRPVENDDLRLNMPFYMRDMINEVMMDPARWEALPHDGEAPVIAPRTDDEEPVAEAAPIMEDEEITWLS